METSPCAVQIKIINDHIEREINNALREQNLTAVQIRVLILLQCAKDHTMSLKEVERHLHVSQPTAAGIVSRLEQKEYVCSMTCEEDRRIKLLKLTQVGLAQCAIAIEKAGRTEQRLIEFLGDEDYAQLGILLGKMMDALGIVPCAQSSDIQD